MLEEEATKFYRSKTNGASKLACGVRAFDSLKNKSLVGKSFVISYSTGSFVKRFHCIITFSSSDKGTGQSTILEMKKLAGIYDNYVEFSILLIFQVPKHYNDLSILICLKCSFSELPASTSAMIYALICDIEAENLE